MYLRCSSCLGDDTLGCSTSPLLCRRWLKVLRGRNGAADLTSLDNSLEVDLLPWCWERRDLRVPVINTPRGWVHQPLSPQKGWYEQRPTSIPPRPKGLESP
jgi:hypothetical protein